VREEQTRKKEHQKKVKKQLEEDKMIRKMKAIVSKAGSLTAEELVRHAASITSFLAESPLPAGRSGMSFPSDQGASANRVSPNAEQDSLACLQQAKRG
jgi:hypothetical protein